MLMQRKEQPNCSKSAFPGVGHSYRRKIQGAKYGGSGRWRWGPFRYSQSPGRYFDKAKMPELCTVLDLWPLGVLMSLKLCNTVSLFCLPMLLLDVIFHLRVIISNLCTFSKTYVCCTEDENPTLTNVLWAKNKDHTNTRFFQEGLDMPGLCCCNVSICHLD